MPLPKSMIEEELPARAQQGDENALAALIARMMPAIRKGAAEAIFRIAAEHENPCPAGIAATVRTISENGGTPLVVCENERITGVIELQDIIKTGIRERLERLRKMGVKTVMVTGDNPLTAKYIAEQAGVDDFIAEAKP